MMKRRLAPLEVVGYTALILVGLFLLYKGTNEQQTGFLIGGTIGLTLGGMGIVSGIRNARWRRHLERRDP